MNSRIRQDVGRLFECYVEVAPPVSGQGESPWISCKFPESYKDEALKDVTKFAFPCDVCVTTIQHFSFVLTNSEGKWSFGFCRLDPKTDNALVILTNLPWHDVFYMFLNRIAELNNLQHKTELREFLAAAYRSPVPQPDTSITISYKNGDDSFTFRAPNPFDLPKIPGNRNLTEYYNASDVDCMMEIFAAMLSERRIIFTSKRLDVLTACVQASNALLYPMVWQHIFIPVLPMQLIDLVQAPMPYVIGVPDAVFKKVRLCEIGDVVIVRLNKNERTVLNAQRDLESIPLEISVRLKKQLKNTTSLVGDGVSRTFLKTLVQLIGGYKDALKIEPGKKITFSEDDFVNSRPASFRPYLRSMLTLQIFIQFIEDRLQMLNTGSCITDAFEMEAAQYSERSSGRFKQQYREWTLQMKKEGSAFFRSVKDKTNPAMKSAVKSVKQGGRGVRSAYNGLRSKFKDNSSDGMTVYSHPSDGHHSAPDSPVVQRRPHTFAAKTYLKDNEMISRNMFHSVANSSDDNVQHISSVSAPESLPDMDLIGELKNQHSMFRDLPIVDRSLKPSWAAPEPRGRAQPPRVSAQISLPDVPTATLCAFDAPTPKTEDFPLITNQSSIYDTPPFDLSPPPYLLHSRDTNSKNILLDLTIPSGVDFPSALNFPSYHAPIALLSPTVSTGSPIPIIPFLSPPHVAPRPYCSPLQAHQSPANDCFGGTPFSTVPPAPVLARKRETCRDLIRLDSATDDDFELLGSKSNTLPLNTRPLTHSLANPLYPFFTPSTNNVTPIKSGLYQITANMSQSNLNSGLMHHSSLPIVSDCNKNDSDLLQEYGLDFTKFSLSRNGDLFSNNDNFSDTSKSTMQSQSKQWATFE